MLLEFLLLFWAYRPDFLARSLHYLLFTFCPHCIYHNCCYNFLTLSFQMQLWKHCFKSECIEQWFLSPGLTCTPSLSLTGRMGLHSCVQRSELWSTDVSRGQSYGPLSCCLDNWLRVSFRVWAPGCDPYEREGVSCQMENTLPVLRKIKTWLWALKWALCKVVWNFCAY